MFTRRAIFEKILKPRTALTGQILKPRTANHVSVKTMFYNMRKLFLANCTLPSIDQSINLFIYHYLSTYMNIKKTKKTAKGPMKVFKSSNHLIHKQKAFTKHCYSVQKDNCEKLIND